MLNINYKQPSNSYYNMGWNDAVDAMANKEVGYKTVSMCVNLLYCEGWNDAVKESKGYAT